jgi:hypothetical protein
MTPLGPLSGVEESYSGGQTIRGGSAGERIVE